MTIDQQIGSKGLSAVVLGGDGTGAEMMREVKRILRWFMENRQLELAIQEPSYGLNAVKETGTFITPDGAAQISKCDLVFFGAAGGPEYDPIYDHLPRSVRRTGSALRLRRELALFANVRPIKAIPTLADVSPLKTTIVEGVDLVIVRELLGGLYFGEPRGVETLSNGDRRGINTHIYLASQVREIGKLAFSIAKGRRKKVCSVEKAAVMESGQMWKEEITIVARDFPDVEVEHMAVDTCAQMLIKEPARFDVIVTDNVFGDILSDCAAMVLGSIGLQASACLGPARGDGTRVGLYEPLDAADFHLAGKDLCNPIGAVLSTALAFELSLDRAPDAQLLRLAVEAVLADGLRTADLNPKGPPARASEIGDAILTHLTRLALL